MSSQTSTVVNLFAERNVKFHPQVLSDASAKLYALPLQVQAKQLASQTQGQKLNSWLGLVLVLLGHAIAIYLLATQSPPDKVKVLPTKPMLVSIIALPAPEPELAPIIEPPKPEVKPIIKPKKVVEKIKPIEKPTERLVEATTEPPKEPEITAPQAAPVLEPVIAKAPPKAEPIIEEKYEEPRFGVSYLNNPAPDYPPMSRRLGEEGRTMMKVLVSAEGLAEDVQIEKSSGSDRLDNAAVNAVKRWRFIPAKRNNQPLSAYVLVPMKFSLDN
jgi:protein TonB